MKVVCFYRLTRFGEIIRSQYDTLSGKITGLAEWQFKYISNDDNWRNGRLSNSGRSPVLGRFEEYMLLNRDCYLCIDYCACGILAFHESGEIFYTEGTGNPYVKDTVEFGGFGGTYREVGWVPTKVLQFGVKPSIYSLVIEECSGMLCVHGMWFKPPYQKEQLTGIDRTYTGYKQLVADKGIGLIYVDNYPVGIFLQDGSIIYEEYKGGS